ncbi:MAG: MFS transporter [Gammaproteobacteria bacterium]|nr:MFS transporter [Gammaproteobacteria bacterium]
MPSIVFLLGAASFVVVAVMTVTGPLLPLIAHDFGTSVGAAGIVVSAFAVPYGAFQIVFGPLGDRAGKLRVIAGAMTVSTVFVLASGLTDSLEGLASMRFLCGTAMAGTVPLAMAYIADEVPYETRQLVIGRFLNGLVLGQIGGGCLGGLVAEYLEWRSIFYLFAACCALVSVALWMRASQQPPAHAAHQRSVGEILRIYWAVLRAPHSRAVVITGTLEGVFIFGVAAFYGAYLRQRFELGYAVIGAVLSMYGVGGMAYSAMVRPLVARLGERRMVVAGTALLGSCYLLLPMLPHWWLAPPLLFLAGFGFYTFHNTMQTQATELDPNARGTALALWVFMMFLGQGFGVLLIGAVIDRGGYGAAFSAAGVGVITLGVWFQRRLGRRVAVC